MIKGRFVLRFLVRYEPPWILSRPQPIILFFGDDELWGPGHSYSVLSQTRVYLR